MKKLLILSLTAGTLLASCSKKNSTTPTTPSNTVTITGSVYNTVSIGTQTWTVDDFKGPGGYTDTLKGDLVGYAYLYTFAQAQAIALPTGWRLPTRADYSKLLLFIGGTTDSYGDGTDSGATAAKLVSSEWPYANGTNITRFSAAPVGYYNSADVVLQGQCETQVFWTSSPIANDPQMDYGCGIDNYLDNNNTRILTAYLDFYRPADKLSLRFVKDN